MNSDSTNSHPNKLNAGEILDLIELVVFDAVGTLLHPAESISCTYRRIFDRFRIKADEHILKAQFKTSFTNRFEPIKILNDDRLAGLVRYLVDNPSIGFGQRKLSHEHLELVELVRQVSSPTNEEHQKKCWQGVVFDCIDCFAPSTSPENRLEILDSLWRHFAQSQAWRVDQQLAGWVKTCQQYKLPWVVASNFDSRLIRVAAGHVEFDPCEKIYDSASLGYQKPDLRFYQTITTDFQLPADRILMIGDNAIGDFLAPKICGWQAHWLEDPVTFSLEGLLQSLNQKP